MEKTMTVVKVMPVVERQYTDKQGQQRIMTSRGLLLTNGIDTLYAEILGDNARSACVAEGDVRRFAMTAACRRWEDKNHDEHYSNDIIINRIGNDTKRNTQQ